MYGACGNPACKTGKHSVDLCASDACPLARDGVHHAVDVGCAACLEHPKPGTDSWRPMQSAVQEFLGILPALASQLQLRVSGSCAPATHAWAASCLAGSALAAASVKLLNFL